MTQAQKVIKYFAIALAVLLIVGIFSGIYRGGAAIIALFEGGGEEYIGETREVDLSLDVLPADLDIDIAASELLIKTGDSLKVETNNDRLKCYIRNGTLIISEDDHGLFFYNSSKKSVLTLTLPLDMVFNEADIDTGAGRILVESLAAKELSLDLGAGEAIIDSLTVSGEADISGGAGRLEIKDSEIGRIDVDHGVGELVITTLIKHGGEFDCGIGNVVLHLIGSEADYSINVEKGLGNIMVGGVTGRHDSIYGTGSSRIEINGGVGSFKVDFNK